MKRAIKKAIAASMVVAMMCSAFAGVAEKQVNADAEKQVEVTILSEAQYDDAELYDDGSSVLVSGGMLGRKYGGGTLENGYICFNYKNGEKIVNNVSQVYLAVTSSAYGVVKIINNEGKYDLKRVKYAEGIKSLSELNNDHCFDEIYTSCFNSALLKEINTDGVYYKIMFFNGASIEVEKKSLTEDTKDADKNYIGRIKKVIGMGSTTIYVDSSLGKISTYDENGVLLGSLDLESSAYGVTPVTDECFSIRTYKDNSFDYYYYNKRCEQIEMPEHEMPEQSDWKRIIDILDDDRGIYYVLDNSYIECIKSIDGIIDVNLEEVTDKILSENNMTVTATAGNLNDGKNKNYNLTSQNYAVGKNMAIKIMDRDNNENSETYMLYERDNYSNPVKIETANVNRLYAVGDDYIVKELNNKTYILEDMSGNVLYESKDYLFEKAVLDEDGKIVICHYKTDGNENKKYGIIKLTVLGNISYTISGLDGKITNIDGREVYLITLNPSNPVITEKQMEQIIMINGQYDIVIDNGEGVTFTFSKGTMQIVPDKKEYDFGVIIIKDFDKIDVKIPNIVERKNFDALIHYRYSGNLPAKATIRFNLGTEFAGKTLYYALLTDGNVSETQKSKVDARGYITVRQTHCSDWIVTSDMIEKSPQTGDNIILIPILLMGIICNAIVFLIVKKKKECY